MATGSAEFDDWGVRDFAPGTCRFMAIPSVDASDQWPFGICDPFPNSRFRRTAGGVGAAAEGTGSAARTPKAVCYHPRVREKGFPRRSQAPAQVDLQTEPHRLVKGGLHAGERVQDPYKVRRRHGRSNPAFLGQGGADRDEGPPRSNHFQLQVGAIFEGRKER